MTDSDYITMRLQEGPGHTPLPRQPRRRRRFVAPAAMGGATLLAAVIAGALGCNPHSARVAAQPPTGAEAAAIRDPEECAGSFLVMLRGGRPHPGSRLIHGIHRCLMELDPHAPASLDLADLPPRTVA